MKNNKNKQDEVMVIDFNHDREAVLDGESWVYTDSLNIAKTIKVENTEVNRKIRQILNEYNLDVGGETPCTENDEYIFKNTDFTYSICYYTDVQNKLRPYYKLSKDLVTLLMFKFKTDRAREFQKLYIAKFNEMERELQWYKSRYLGIITRNNLTDAIKDDYKHEYNGYNIYVDFTDLIYTSLYGLKAWQIRQIHSSKFPLNKNGKPSGNIRPWLRDEDVEMVDKLEKEICTFIRYNFTYEQIKDLLDKRFEDKNILVLLDKPRE